MSAEIPEGEEERGYATMRAVVRELGAREIIAMKCPDCGVRNPVSKDTPALAFVCWWCGVFAENAEPATL